VVQFQDLRIVGFIEDRCGSPGQEKEQVDPD
jgi:hypothetical protein